jgi:hypothetical protein
VFLHPAGEPWAMPQTLLQYSLFHSYLIPEIILLVANGLLSFWVLWADIAEAARLRLVGNSARMRVVGVAHR